MSVFWLQLGCLLCTAPLVLHFFHVLQLLLVLHFFLEMHSSFAWRFSFVHASGVLLAVCAADLFARLKGRLFLPLLLILTRAA